MEKCGYEIRGGKEICAMATGHRGRHASVTFTCDLCGKTRRGTPWRSNEDIVICWMCEQGKT